MKKILLPIIIILIFSGCQKINSLNESVKGITDFKDEYIANLEKNNPDKQSLENLAYNNILPTVFIQIPFACQFPVGNMNDPYQEACEETSIIMAKAFINNDTQENLSNTYIDQQINDLVNWQINAWGGHYDINTYKTLELMQKYYDIRDAQIVEIKNIDDIKLILSSEKIIIAPTYGMNLENSYFTAPGPAYHMLVITGYDEQNFITNDPGIGLGKNFKYTYNNLFESIYDLPNKANMKAGFIKEHHYLMKDSTKKVITVGR